jgi:hypothetical protein
VISVGGDSRISAAGQSVRLDSANNFGGAVNIRAANASVNDVNALDLGTLALSGDLTFTAAGPVTDSGVLTVGGQTHISAAGQSIILDQAHGFGGAVHLRAAQLEISRSDSLRLPQGSLLQAQTGSIVLRAGSDLWTSGLTLSAAQALLDAGQAIKAEAQEDAQPLSFDGGLHLQAQAGIGGFDFERVLIEQRGDAARISASNARGDVVIAGVQGLTLAPQSVQSDSNDGWVVLLGGRGAVVEQGDLIVRPNLVRATGINWMAREQIDTSLLLTAVLKSGAMQVQQGASPIERMNRLLAEGFAQSDAADEPVLESSPQIIKTQSSVMVGAPRQVNAQTVSVMAAPKSASQLLEMAMTLTQQGGNPAMGDAESLGAWVVRTAPSESSRESGREPIRDSSREPSVPAQPAAQTPPTAPAQQPADAPVPGNAPSTPQSESPAGQPAAPQGNQSAAPAAVGEPGALQVPAQLPAQLPGQVPGQVPVQGSDQPQPTSDVRWLLPQDELGQWLPSDSLQTEPAAQPGMLSSLKGAAVKLSQWLGWSDAALKAPSGSASVDTADAAGSASKDGPST